MDAPQVYPIPLGLLWAVQKYKGQLTANDIEDAKAALELTDGNTARAAGLLRQDMPIAKAVAAIQAAQAK
jgi:hypothetical protein